MLPRREPTGTGTAAVLQNAGTAAALERAGTAANLQRVGTGDVPGRLAGTGTGTAVTGQRHLPGTWAAISDVEQLVGCGDTVITVVGASGVEVVRLSAAEREDLITALVGHRRHARACADSAVAGAVA